MKEGIGIKAGALLLTLFALPGVAFAEEGGLAGKDLSLAWVIPFVGMLLSIAAMPLLAPHFWERHFGKIAALWALLFVMPFSLQFGIGMALHQVVHTALMEYLPFIILLLALFTVAGGIYVRGNLHGAPLLNTGILALGTGLASIMGTTGAAMLLIRPLIRANDNRKHNAHVVIFFIFLVANIGGALTPLGDPPLFLGFLKGVDFFWTAKAIFEPMLVAVVALLIVFYGIDHYYYHHREEVRPPRLDPTPDNKLGLLGKWNFLLLAGVVGSVLLSGIWKPGVQFHIYGTELELQDLVRDVLLLVIAVVSWKITPSEVRKKNDYTWAPIKEVAILFAGIFVTIIPTIAILRAGMDGHFAPLVSLVSDSGGQPIDAAYFWLTGILSSFLDNAPTYLAFFNLAGGDAQVLMGPLASTLLAISAGAVFMGANTYIGNAPNFMVKSIAEERGIKMPSFFGYMAWSGLILLPCFGLITLLFFHVSKTH